MTEHLRNVVFGRGEVIWVFCGCEPKHLRLRYRFRGFLRGVQKGLHFQKPAGKHVMSKKEKRYHGARPR